METNKLSSSRAEPRKEMTEALAIISAVIVSIGFSVAADSADGWPLLATCRGRQLRLGRSPPMVSARSIAAETRESIDPRPAFGVVEAVTGRRLRKRRREPQHGKAKC
jgi:hypothetical protein